MRIDLHELPSARFSISSTGEHGTRQTIEIVDSHALRGTLERSAERLALDNVSVERLSIAGLDWRVGGAHALSGLPVELADARISLTLATGANDTSRALAGHLECGRVAAEALSLAVVGHRATGGLSASDIKWTAAQQTWTAQLGEVLVSKAQTVLAGLVLRLAEARVGGAVIDASAGGEVSVRVSLDALSMANVNAQGRGIDGAVASVSLPDGARVDVHSAGIQVHIPQIQVAGLAVTIDDIGALFSRRAGVQSPSSALSLRQILDVTQLDRLSGRLHLDATVDARLPVIGNRVATHEFRVPITDGMFNYRQLERGLSALEDSVLDFETRDDLFFLELDIPVVGRRKDLIRWRLPSEDDVFLAKAKSVRLRTLLDPEVVVEPDDKGESQLTVRRVSLTNFALDLSAARADGTSERADGAITDLVMDGLSLAGELHLFTEKPGALTLTIKSLSLHVRDLDLGAMHLENARLVLTDLTGTQLDFCGTKPGALRLGIGNLHLEDVRVRLPAKNHAGDGPAHAPQDGEHGGDDKQGQERGKGQAAEDDPADSAV